MTLSNIIVLTLSHMSILSLNSNNLGLFPNVNNLFLKTLLLCSEINIPNAIELYNGIPFIDCDVSTIAIFSILLR